MYAPVPNGQGGYDRIPINNQHDFYAYLDAYANSDDAFVQKFINQFKTGAGTMTDWYNSYFAENKALSDIQGGANPNDVLADYIKSGQTPSQNMSDYIANAQAGYNTQQAQNYETNMRDTSIISTGNQLSAIGLSPSSVIQTGAVSSNGVAAADTVKGSAASQRHQAVINRFNNQMGLAKSLIGAAGSMASSGIYGAALGAVKHSAQAVAATAAHSGLKAISATKSSSMTKAQQDSVWKWFEDNPA